MAREESRAERDAKRLREIEAFDRVGVATWDELKERFQIRRLDEQGE